ncbi:transcriptional repressor TCF25-domain-containing protein [Xylariaceae sp. FL0016]|nr:transcriptional repressor TCF25-domain-containing protein [Xylariaceae sp. FL0016]
MSTRQLRKLQKQKELEQLQANNPASESDESEDNAPAPKSKASIFSSFAALEDQDDENSGNEEDEEQNETVESTTTPSATPSRADAPKSSAKKSKKKKKKARKSEATVTKLNFAAKDAADDIDRVLQELNLSDQKKSGVTNNSVANTSEAKAYERICELLRINTYHLKVINEMRNLFGREAIAHAHSEENEERTRAQQPRRSQQQVDLETFLKGQPGKTLPEVTLRRNPFLPGKDTWPRAATEGLTMKQLKSAGHQGTVEFGFVHDQHYNTLETQFFALVQMYDPMQLVYFLHQHPYHVSSLIQVSKVAKQDQNSALCGDLCERALFTFGRVSLSTFRQKLDEGKARLDFKRPENRQFWLAGYHYLRSLVLKGTYRTALEWSKLLLSMDLADPYGIIHFLHPMAIRAHESKWFIDFCDSEAMDKCETAQDYIRQTLILARLQQQDIARAKALLIEGMERLPWLFGGLYKALNLDVPRAIWGMQPRDQHEELFTELYIHQTKSLWDNTQATALLKEVGQAARKPESQTFAFPPVVGRNVGRFVYLDNTPSLMAKVPGDMLSSSPNWEFDPLPPSVEQNVFSYDSQKAPWQPNRRETTGFGDNVPNDRAALMALLARVRQEGGPDLEEELDQALGPDGNAREGDEGQGYLQAFLRLISPGRPRDDDGSVGDSDHLPLADMMPGAWASESDSEMPVLLPMDDDDDAEDDTDDDMPVLEQPAYR